MRIAVHATQSTVFRVEAAAKRAIVFLEPSPLPSPRTIAQDDPDVVLIDSDSCAPSPELKPLRSYLRSHPHVGLLVAGPLNKQLARLVVSMGRERALDVTLHSTDSPTDVWRALRNAYLLALPSRVLMHLEGLLGELDPPIARAVRMALTEATPPFEVMPDLAAAAGVNLRTLYRRFEAVGLDHPKQIIRVGRFMRQLPLLFHRTHRLADIYRQFGFADYNDFQFHVRRTFGVNPRDLRYSADPTRFPEHIVHALRATPRGSAGRIDRRISELVTRGGGPEQGRGEHAFALAPHAPVLHEEEDGGDGLPEGMEAHRTTRMANYPRWYFERPLKESRN